MNIFVITEAHFGTTGYASLSLSWTLLLHFSGGRNRPGPLGSGGLGVQPVERGGVCCRSANSQARICGRSEAWPGVPGGEREGCPSAGGAWLIAQPQPLNAGCRVVSFSCKEQSVWQKRRVRTTTVYTSHIFLVLFLLQRRTELLLIITSLSC